MKRLKLADWSEIANIIGAVTVVVSLVFLALQVKENTSALRSQNQRALIDSLENLEIGLVTDAEFAALMLRAESGEALTGVDHYRVESLVYLYLNNWEQALHDYRHGLLEEEIWRALNDWLTWKARHTYFRDVLMAATEAGTYSDLFEQHLREVVFASAGDDQGNRATDAE